MKLMCTLNSLTYLSDYQEIGVEALLVGNDDISSRHALSLSLEQIQHLSKQFSVYVLVNLLYSETELPILRKWLQDLAKTDITGIVFQDFGVLQMLKNMDTHWDLMYAPETLNTNHETLNDLAQMGISSALLAREINLDDIERIASKTSLAIMVQVHGVMYMAQSRRKLVSNYASHLHQPLHQGPYLLQASDSDLTAWIYEDEHGTNIQTEAELCALDDLSRLNQCQVDWIFVDTHFMEPYRAVEIVSLYHDAVISLNQGSFLKDIHDYRHLLQSLMKDHKQDSGFYHEKTVYKLEDVRVMDDEKRNQSNH